MIPIEYYTPIYYLFLSFFILITTFPFVKMRKISSYPDGYLTLVSSIILVLCILFIGLRDPYASSRFLGDTGAYTRTYELVQKGIRTEFNKDPGFYLYMKFCSNFMSVQMFYLISAIIYIYLPFLTFKKWFGKQALFALLALVTSMSFWAFGINGLRNGLAASIFIFALGFMNKKIIMYVFLFISFSFHNSMILPVLAIIFIQFYSNTKKLIVFWILTIPISLIVGKNMLLYIREFMLLLGINTDPRSDVYLSGNTNFGLSQRFRLDFLIYSAIPIVLSWWFIVKKNYSNKLYAQLLNTYILSNGIWILLIYIPFTNRLAYLSWFLMPIILIFPLLRKSTVKNTNRWTISIVYMSLLFTLIMQFK